jgi:exodeoxyribonuclease-3
MGDMNVSHSDLDIGIGEKSHQRWLQNGKCGFLPEERKWMDRLLAWGLVDVWRSRNPKENHSFTWFDYRSHGFTNNRGLRIDMILATEELTKRCTGAGIYYPIRDMSRPSDHAPVWSSFDV